MARPQPGGPNLGIGKSGGPTIVSFSISATSFGNGLFPFNQYDWPLPNRGPEYPVGLRTWIQGTPPLPLLVNYVFRTPHYTKLPLPPVLPQWIPPNRTILMAPPPSGPPPGEAVLALPFIAPVVPVAWQTPNLLPLNTRPVVQFNWPLPITAVYTPTFWIAPLNPAFLTPAVQQPFNQEDWPVPQDNRRLGLTITASPALNLPQIPLPFNQQSWPLPQAPLQQAYSWIASLNLNLLTPPPASLDWQLPRTDQRLAIGFTSGPPLTQPTSLPFNQDDWAPPRGPAPPVSGYIFSGLQLLTAQQIPLPFNQHDWPVPRAAARDNSLLTWINPGLKVSVTFVSRAPLYTQRAQQPWPDTWIRPNNIGLLTATAAPLPLNQYDWPVLAQQPRQALTWIQSNVALFTTTPPTKPPGQPDLSLPIRAQQQLAPTWIGEVITVGATFIPCRVVDWGGEFYVQPLVPWIQPNTLPLLTATPAAKPPGNVVWDVPKAAPFTTPWDFRNNIALLTTSPQVPLNQYSWPLPGSVTWQPAGPYSVSIALQNSPLPNNQHDWPLPQAPLFQTPSLTQFASLALQVTPAPLQPPSNQKTWPLPLGHLLAALYFQAAKNSSSLPIPPPPPPQVVAHDWLVRNRRRGRRT